ncbi:hypothetical protein T484DRAFT_1794482 [Baffinella frigidus]|nr:hypothetical protein T484DRAFT_1794482 [Cryptophyta sp. CCMP2293]
MAEHDPAGLDRSIKREPASRLSLDLEHIHDTGLLHAADLQLPILASPPTCVQSIPGYEGGVFDPQKLGVACIVVPPSDCRGPNTLGDFQFTSAGKKTNAAEPLLIKDRMKVRPHKGKETGPDFTGRWYKFMLDAAFLVSEAAPAAVSNPAPAANGRLPFVVMHMRKPPQQTSVFAREPTTAVDAAARAPTDAPPTGHLAAAAEITPDESLEHITPALSLESLEEVLGRLGLAGTAAAGLEQLAAGLAVCLGRTGDEPPAASLLPSGVSLAAGAAGCEPLNAPAMAASATSCNHCGKGAKKKGANVAGAAEEAKPTAEEAKVAKKSAAHDAWENEEGGSELGSGDDESDESIEQEERLPIPVGFFRGDDSDPDDSD